MTGSVHALTPTADRAGPAPLGLRCQQAPGGRSILSHVWFMYREESVLLFANIDVALDVTWAVPKPGTVPPLQTPVRASTAATRPVLQQLACLRWAVQC